MKQSAVALRRGLASALLVMGVLVVISIHAAASTYDTPRFALQAVSEADVGATPASTPPAPTLPLSKASVTAAATGGAVLDVGNAPDYGSSSGQSLNEPIVGMARTPDGGGYWLVASDGGVFSYGDAGFFGSAGGMQLNEPIVGMAPTPSGLGYWLVGSDGGVFNYGNAGFFGSEGSMQLNEPIVGMAPTPSGLGYWLVAADGGVFTFGDAGFHGSAGGMQLNEPIVGMAPTPSGLGYWLVGSDGGVFNYGNAGFFGSEGSMQLNEPIVGMAPTSSGLGYWLVAADGGVFTFGDAGFYGSPAGTALAQPVVGIAPTLRGDGYWLVQGDRNPLPQPLGALLSPALVEALNQRAGGVSASVLDLATGYTYNYRPGQYGITASIVKVEILGTLLAQAQTVGRGLTPTEQSLAASMIEFSDNDSATDLWNEVGGPSAVGAFDRSVGMTSTTPALAWGLTVTTAADQVALLQHLVEPNPVLSYGSRVYELDLMEQVTPSQAWGVSAGTVVGTTVALKNGWLPVGSEWTVNSIGWVSGSGRDYLIGVTTSSDPSEGYGIASISVVADAVWSALGH